MKCVCVVCMNVGWAFAVNGVSHLISSWTSTVFLVLVDGRSPGIKADLSS